MNKRIELLRKSLGLNQEKFGEAIGITKAAVSNWETGRRKVPDSSLKLICKEFNVDYIWLTTGEGGMFHESDDEIMDLVDKVMYGENEFYKDLFKTFARLGEEELEALKKIMDTYINIQEEKKG